MPRIALQSIELPRHLTDRPIPGPIQQLLDESLRRTVAFHDRRESTDAEHFVASDHPLVYRTLDWIAETRLATGNRFIEWGCGFAVNACAAASLGWDVLAVEVEPKVVAEAAKMIAMWQQPVELLQGNFLPPNAERFSEDPYLPSLGHSAESIYAKLDMQIDDFDIIFAYPWPGEHRFIDELFAVTAAPGALLVTFLGPNEITVQQKMGRAFKR
ncbi:hypothetical protein FF011L_54260 [Roseimaritima multifibrata]|uniref:Methyltransferase n=1 Tax=Roseimaritima multifibrata TaxID=1930274 RepID=A0A517MP15_9BACT|nr:class I SAM-dependent methyltransferase [Roseimaritima multifibrata]QDS96614.1 hypothetical protein FF011L_54260 [Roseimaritima multifibrata]